MSTLELELIGGPASVLAPGPEPKRPPPTPTRMRDSHHALARALARGLSPMEAAVVTGYSASRVASLQGCPTFRELMEHYRLRESDARVVVEEKFLIVAEDARQELHDRLLDEPEAMSTQEVIDLFKVMADRAGYSPVTRSVNKNLNLNIGTRLDAAPPRPRDE